MCGIIGYIGGEQAAPIILGSLARLEYRGYDSAGIAVLDGDRLTLEKRAGKLDVLVDAVQGHVLGGTAGIGHTRWATHGGVSDCNAHPHADCSGDAVVVHNGIVENFAALRDALCNRGHRFSSETDSEIIAHLIEAEYAAGRTLTECVRRALGHIEGTAALVVLSRREPEHIVAARIGNAGAVAIGYGDGEMLVASDLPGLLERCSSVAYLAHGEIACISKAGVTFFDSSQSPIKKTPLPVVHTSVAPEKGKFRHFMHKEIFEQPAALLATLHRHVTPDTGHLDMDDLSLTRSQIAGLKRIIVVAMGSSLHAAMIGRQYFERLTGLPTEVDNASEFRYRRPVLSQDTLVVSISQSGETADTLAAMEEGRRKTALQVTICNVDGAQTTRIADAAVLTCCGPEVGVASTKTFTCSLLALYLLAARIGYLRGVLSGNCLQNLIEDAERLPGLVAGQLCAAYGAASPYAALAAKYREMRDLLVLGRGLHYPIALEAALKLKEIAYLHAEGYPAGEMKHGPIALIGPEVPALIFAPQNDLYEKTISSVQQIRARRGATIVVATAGDRKAAALADDVLFIPRAPELLLPIVSAVASQLLAYELAVCRCNDVDQPRNLAKTVTVE